MKNVIITGGNGFVGTWLVKELSDKVENITVIVRNEKSDISKIKDIPNVNIVYCELENLLQLEKTLVKKEYDVFYHLAWAGSTGNLRADYNLQLQNAKWTCDAVRLAANIGCKRFVGAGTLAELDCNSYIKEDGATPNSVSNYGTAKITAHYMSKTEANLQKIDHVWAYLSNTYGIGNRTSNFVNFASKTMLEGKKAEFTPGEQMYDFVYVTDTAQALYLLGEKGKNNYGYYIGSTKPKKLKYFIQEIRDAIDPQIPLYLGAIPFNGITQPAEVFDCSKLVQDTGYTPKVSFEEGITMTVKWLKNEMQGE
jgi:NAD-dependent epimerase/dehydratase